MEYTPFVNLTSKSSAVGRRVRMWGRSCRQRRSARAPFGGEIRLCCRSEPAAHPSLTIASPARALSRRASAHVELWRARAAVGSTPRPRRRAALHVGRRACAGAEHGGQQRRQRRAGRLCRRLLDRAAAEARVAVQRQTQAGMGPSRSRYVTAVTLQPPPSVRLPKNGAGSVSSTSQE